MAAAKHEDRWLDVTYRVTADAAAIDARAQALALEQSVELPLAAVADPRVLREVVGQVAGIVPTGPRAFEVTIRLATETIGADAGQLLNMLFGNSSLQPDVELLDAAIPPALAERFRGPRFGIAGFRDISGVQGRPLTCAALKPQGLSAPGLAALARTFARAGIDVVKDDHGLADQSAAPFDARVRHVQQAIDEENRASGRRCLYAPSLSGDATRIREQWRIARECGVAMLMVAPMICGVSTLAALATFADMPILAHPALAGATRIASPLLLGKLFRLFGADATIFPNSGGRFGYSAAECARIADNARLPWYDMASMLPVPAGGMAVENVGAMRELFGNDTMLLIGGSLLLAGERLPERCGEFVAAVHAPDVR